MLSPETREAIGLCAQRFDGLRLADRNRLDRMAKAFIDTPRLSGDLKQEMTVDFAIARSLFRWSGGYLSADGREAQALRLMFLHLDRTEVDPAWRDPAIWPIWQETCVPRLEEFAAEVRSEWLNPFRTGELDPRYLRPASESGESS